MEILLPYYNNNDYPFAPPTFSTTTGVSNRVIGTMQRAKGKPKDDGSRSSNSNDDGTSRVIQEEEVPRVFVQEPQPFDVLCGHDRNYNKHPGNKEYRKLIEGHVNVYKLDISKQEKMNITRSILSIMEHRYGSRFIRRSCGSTSTEAAPDLDDTSATRKKRVRRSRVCKTVATWEVLTHMEARDKISHALRSCHRQRRQQSQGGNIGTFYDDSILAGIQDAGSINVAIPGTDSDPNIGFPYPADLGHDKHLLHDDIGLYGIDSFDESSLSFDDSHTLLQLFSGGGVKSSPSASATTFKTDNVIVFPDDPWDDRQKKLPEER